MANEIATFLWGEIGLRRPRKWILYLRNIPFKNVVFIGLSGGSDSHTGLIGLISLATQVGLNGSKQWELKSLLTMPTHALINVT